MAHANKRTSVLLRVQELAFLIIIIVLVIAPQSGSPAQVTLKRLPSPPILPVGRQPALTDQQLLLNMFERPFQKREQPLTDSESRLTVFEEDGTRTAGGPPASGPLALAHSIPRGSVFSTFFKSHRLAAKELYNYFMQAKNMKELSLMADSVRNGLNGKLFIYALSFVILRKPEMRALCLPNLVEVFPSSFLPRTIMETIEQLAREPASTDEDPIITEYGPEFSGTHLNPEHRVAYFREDYGINLHHWHWHLSNPVSEGVERDRKGELFYYMHQQMLARYDMDRLSVGLNRVEKLFNLRNPIPNGYFSKLTLDNAGEMWGSRQDNTVLQDYRRGKYLQDPYHVSDLEQQHNRLMDAIHQGHLTDREGNRTMLTDEGVPHNSRGIVLLGNAIEADTILSVNSPFYGNLHNMGHNIISAAHDPDEGHKENLGVMADVSTAMRDPVFYRWHKYIDDLFQEYKLTQPPYTMEQLFVPNVTVAGVEVECAGRKNTLTTGWNTREFDASHGLDFQANHSVKVHLTHLNHSRFQYIIKVENRRKADMDVTIRIYMAPKLNERGVRMNFMEQRLLWAEMDRFKYTLNLGANEVTRNSTYSSITNPKDFTFWELNNMPEPNNSAPENNQCPFCWCGWPQHMLLPRGKQEGMDFELLVMVTDWELDRVDQLGERLSCGNGASFCGILNSLYPDARPMGFPFDRRPPILNGQSLDRAADLARLSNVALQEIQIVFTNEELKE